MPSTAVSTAAVSRVVGYDIEPGNFAPQSLNLPQCIAVIGEMNDANQTTPLTPTLITSAKQAATLYGWGSPLYQSMRHYFPTNGGGGANGIPVWAFPQAAAGGAAANAQTITVTGTPTANITHTVIIGGRGQLETGSYDINILSTDTVTQIAVKIKNAINGVLQAPVAAANTAGVVTITAKWKGLTSEAITISIQTYGAPSGVSYAVAETVAGSGTPSIDAALALFGNTWFTLVDNTYGLVASVLTSLNTFNGNPNSKTGRWSPTVMKPFIAIAGSVLNTNTTSADTVITDADKLNATNMVAPAPYSLGLPLDASADYIIRFANCAQNTPNIDIQGSYSVDIPMPAAGNVPDEQDWNVRNAIVKMGMSTATIKNGAYEAQDMVTTYHPDGETPPQFRYGRDVMDDMNIKFQFYVMQAAVILNKQIANDNDNVTAANVVKPKDVKAAIASLAKSLVAQGLIVNAAFTIKSSVVNISTTNPNRLEITFSYKRSGVVRIVSTTVTAGFNYGQVG